MQQHLLRYIHECTNKGNICISCVDKDEKYQYIKGGGVHSITERKSSREFKPHQFWSFSGLELLGFLPQIILGSWNYSWNPTIFRSPKFLKSENFTYRTIEMPSINNICVKWMSYFENSKSPLGQCPTGYILFSLQLRLQSFLHLLVNKPYLIQQRFLLCRHA